VEYLFYLVEKHLCTNTGEKLYWCAKVSDIFVNMFGFMIGLFIRLLLVAFFARRRKI
jgi:hypothetical protein